MAKDYILQIMDFDKGIASSPTKGFEKMVGIDLTSAPGIARVNFLAAKQSSTTITGQPTWADIDYSTGNIYLCDTDHKVYKSTDAGVTWSLVTHASPSTGAGNGLKVWKNYLFLSGNQAIDVMKIADGTWTDGWQSVSTSGGLHPMVWGQDDILYHGSANLVASIQQTIGSTFAPGTAGTYTFTSAALTLPSNVFIRCMEELGTNLLVGTFDARTTNPSTFVSLVYPWDRTSTSFRLPLRFSGDGIHAMKTIGQTTYVLHGKTGKISYTNGSQVFPLGGLNYSGTDTYTPQPGAIMNHNGRLFFGFGSGASYFHGVYSLTPSGFVGNENPILNCENTTSNGTSQTSVIGVLLPIDSYKYVIGWQDATGPLQGADLVGGSGYRTHSTGSVAMDSAFYNIGLPNLKRKVRSMSAQLEQPLTSGQAMTFGYRTNRNAAYTQLGESSYSTANLPSGASSFEIPFNGLETDSIQIRTQMGAGTSDTGTPGLIQLTLQ